MKEITLATTHREQNTAFLAPFQCKFFCRLMFRITYFLAGPEAVKFVVMILKDG